MSEFTTRVAINDVQFLWDRLDQLKSDFDNLVPSGIRGAYFLFADRISLFSVGHPLELSDENESIIGGCSTQSEKRQQVQLMLLMERGGHLLNLVQSNGWSPSYWAKIESYDDAYIRWGVFLLTGPRQTHVCYPPNDKYRAWIDDVAEASAIACDYMINYLLNAALKNSDVELISKLNAAEILEQLQPSVRIAYFSYEFAVTKKGRKLTDQAAYDFLKSGDVASNLNDISDDYQLPTFETWSRYVRKARKALEKQKNEQRVGRSTGKSIVRGDQI